MLILIVIFLITEATCLHFGTNAGSVIFFKRCSNDCWTQDDLSKLQARMIFENIGLPTLPPDKMNAKFNADTIKYFKKAFAVVEFNKDRHNKQILKEALADTIGGHLRKEILPNARFAYYAGFVPYRSVRELHNFYDSLKGILNTQGLGWKGPNKIPLQTNLTVGKILIGTGKSHDPCSSLVIKRYSQNCIHIPSPVIDDEKRPAAVSLPFIFGGLVSLTSPSSENIFLKYYTTAARCILRSSPQECRHGDFVNFNNELWHWMKRYVAPHLMDEDLYAGYGGVLRIAAAVQNYGKGLSRRNLFDNDYEHKNSFSPSSLLYSTYCFDFGTNSYTLSIIYLMLMAAVAICFLHICYTWIWGPSGECRCSSGKRKNRQRNREVAYTTVDSNFPSMLPPHSAQKGSEEISKRRSRSASAGTARDQKVYDLNENTEKVMSIVMSDKESSETESSSSEDGDLKQAVVVNNRSPLRTPRSPPKIEASVAQLKIEKTPQRTPRTDRNRALYSTSTITQSEVTRFGPISETGWSDSYTTDRTISSVGLKSHGRKSKRARDFAWAQRASKQNLKSSTDLDQNSTVTTTVRR